MTNLFLQLVVITTAIAVLIGILLPVVSKARGQGMTVSDLIRAGGSLQRTSRLNAGGKVSLTAPDSNDWLALIRR